MSNMTTCLKHESYRSDHLTMIQLIPFNLKRIKGSVNSIIPYQKTKIMQICLKTNSMRLNALYTIFINIRYIYIDNKGLQFITDILIMKLKT